MPFWILIFTFKSHHEINRLTSRYEQNSPPSKHKKQCCNHFFIPIQQPATVCQPGVIKEDEETFFDWGVSYRLSRYPSIPYWYLTCYWTYFKMSVLMSKFIHKSAVVWSPTIYFNSLVVTVAGLPVPIKMRSFTQYISELPYLSTTIR